MNKSDDLKALAGAFAKFQSEVQNPKNTGKNPQFNSKYAPLEAVLATVKPVLAKYGLAVFQSTSSEGENIIIKTMLLHESGQFLESDPLVLPAYQKHKGGAKEFNAQGAGSAITYGRRYQLSAVLGISSEDDDDANHASGRQTGQSQQSAGQRQQTKPNTQTRQPNQNSQQAPQNDGKAKAINEAKKLIRQLAGFSENATQGTAAIMEALQAKVKGNYRGIDYMSEDQAKEAITYLHAWIDQKEKKKQGA